MTDESGPYIALFGLCSFPFLLITELDNAKGHCMTPHIVIIHALFF